MYEAAIPFCGDGPKFKVEGRAIMTHVEEIRAAALLLSAEERVRLAEDLLGSLEYDGGLFSIDDPAFIAELQRRERDGSTPVPWSVVEAELEARLRS